MATAGMAITEPGLDLCAQQQVQVIGHIQPHGLLFALSEADLVVRQVSANIYDLLGTAPEAILGQSFENVLGGRQFDMLRSRLFLDGPLTTDPLPLMLRNGELSIHCILHRHDGMLIAECELVHGAFTIEPLSLDAHIREPLWRLGEAPDVAALAELAANEVSKLSGFNRVMVYRFDEDWNGEVIAETGGASLSYLGLRFPAGDIPPPVRELFLRNPLRAIVDVDALPVPIVPEVSQINRRPLDLTYSYLRSAASVHLEYMRNMKVQASMTVSIIVRHRLWGMIACHHATPHRLDYSTRSVCGLIGQLLASQIALRTDNLVMQARLKSRKLLEEFMVGMDASASLAPGDLDSASLLHLVDADGYVSRIDGVISSQGIVAREELLQVVIERLRSLAIRGIASSDSLNTLYSHAADYAPNASGALYIGLGDDAGDYLLLLRRELIKTVVWAGNPDKEANLQEPGNLHPRSSFAAWQETVRGHSRAWNEAELESAGILREQLLRLHAARKLAQAEARVQYLANHDEQTGLLNPRAIKFRLDQCVEEAAASHTSFAVLFIDLEQFKQLKNDIGRAAADFILREIVNQVQQQLRPEDLLGRLGDDELIAILPRIPSGSDMSQTVKSLLRTIEAALAVKGKPPIKIAPSIGHNTYPDDGTTTDELLNRSETPSLRLDQS